MKKEHKSRVKFSKNISMTTLFIGTVSSIILATLTAVVFIFIAMYQTSMEENAIVSSEQAVVQVSNTVSSYTEDMEELMDLISGNILTSEENWENFADNLIKIRSDLVVVAVYNDDGEIVDYRTGELVVKSEVVESLSYIDIGDETDLVISKPHVESVFVEEYPWVVTLSKKMIVDYNNSIQISLDISFSEIASYLDDVGIGLHGYCFIMDNDGNIIYHPQQRLIYAGLKEESTEEIKSLDDGSYVRSDVIYTVESLENCDWRIVGVSYVDEMITNKVSNMMEIIFIVVILVIITMIIVGGGFAQMFSRSAKQLKSAMQDFEKDAENFEFEAVNGTKEIAQLSDSFAHMVVRIQRLMEKVRQEEISLRKTELNALQAQINPHFLYNTLDSIAWMCEEERTQEAVEMVNALAKLFRISISKGHELITLDKEVQHAQSYLKIQKFRYKNQFTYVFEIDEECLDYLCNKITLQPIIENSIYHGLNRMVDEGEIIIRVYQTEKDIVLEVEDNGVGMTEEECQELILRESGDKMGIGIKNVHDRVRIYFGNQYGLEIASELDEGTKVSIRMPKVKEGKYEV